MSGGGHTCSCGERYYSEHGRVDCEKSHVRRSRVSQTADIRNRLSEKRARDIVALQEEIDRLRDNLKTIASGELGTIEECMSFANTCWRISSQPTRIAQMVARAGAGPMNLIADALADAYFAWGDPKNGLTHEAWVSINRSLLIDALRQCTCAGERHIDEAIEQLTSADSEITR